MKIKTASFVLLFLSVWIMTPPPATPEGRSRSKPKLFNVKLVPMAGEYSHKMIKAGNQHPYEISEDAFLRMMRNFNYQNKKKTMNGWEEKKIAVFPEKVIVESAPYLRVAFLRAGPSQKVEFESESPTGKTICDIFVQREEINWRFYHIRGNPRSKGMWMLARGYLQEYYGTGDKLLSAQGLLGGGNYTDITWIHMPLLQVLAEVNADNKLVEGRGAGETREDGKNKLEKLRALTALYHKTLVSEEDYRKKVDQLVKDRAGEKLEIEEELEYLKILKDEKIISRDAYMQKKDMLLEKY